MKKNNPSSNHLPQQLCSCCDNRLIEFPSYIVFRTQTKSNGTWIDHINRVLCELCTNGTNGYGRLYKSYSGDGAYSNFYRGAWARLSTKDGSYIEGQPFPISSKDKIP